MDPNDDILQQIIDAGLYGQRMRPLQDQYQLGEQWMQPQTARGRQVGNTYVAASPWEHLSNAIRQVVGGYMANKAQQGQQELTDKLGSQRKAYDQSLQDNSGKPGEFMPGGAGDQRAMERLILAGSGSGDPGMQQTAQTYMQMQHQKNELAKLQQQIDYQNNIVGLKAREQKTQFDPLGNRVTTPTHAPAPNSVLPLSTGGGGGPSTPKTPWSPEALDKDAEALAVAGDYKRMPGKIGAAYDLAVRKRSTELYPDASRALNKADYVSNMTALRKLQVAQDSLESFEKGMLQNGKLMLDTAKGIVDVGSPLFNQPLRAWKFKAGDPKAAQFNAARQVFVQEASKVLGGAVQGGGVTEGQRHEAEGLLRGDMTLPQMEATLQTLEADATNRKNAAAGQIEAIRGRMSGKPPQPSPDPAAATPSAKRKHWDPATGTLKEGP